MFPSIVTIASPSWQVADSYGRYALEVLRQLQASGIEVNTIGGGAPNHQFRPTGVNLLFGYPTNFIRFGQIANLGLKVAFTAWESTVMHREWIPILNSCAAVVVPCQWNELIFRENGVIAPIHVIPHGISSAFHYVERREQEVFRFLCIGDRKGRKGYIEAMNAFIKAFGHREDAELVVKSRRPVLPALTNTNIRAVAGEFSDQEIQNLYAGSDCLIWSSKAEGFGWPPREFAATGGISICTNYSGMADALDQWGIGVGYTLAPAWMDEPAHAGMGEWAEVDIDQLVEKLVEVRSMPFSERLKLGIQFSRNAARLYRWEEVGREVIRILGELTGSLSVEGGNYADRRAV